MMKKVFISLYRHIYFPHKNPQISSAGRSHGLRSIMFPSVMFAKAGVIGEAEGTEVRTASRLLFKLFGGVEQRLRVQPYR